MDDLNILFGVVGFKINVIGGFLILVSVVFMFSDDGFCDEDVILIFGVDFSF